MKRVLFGFIFSVITIFSYSQGIVSHQDWVVANSGEWASFYWGVTRTQYSDYQGKYYYYVYFYSNSYFNTKTKDYQNYDRASTYIRDINISMKEYSVDTYNNLKYFNTVNVNVPYFSCDWNYDASYYCAWFWSYQPYNKFKITYSKVSAFDYSIY